MQSPARFLLFTGISILVISCKTLFAPADYVKWIENPANGLKQDHEVKGVHFELQYKPVDYIIANENAKNELSESFHQQRKEKLGDLFYFSLSLKSGTQDLLMHNLDEEQEYYQRVNYYALDFQQDIKMLIGSDTLPCLMYQFENTYGVAPYIKMSLAFSGKKKEQALKNNFSILIYDRVFGGGWLNYSFDNKKMNAVPEIKVN